MTVADTSGAQASASTQIKVTGTTSAVNLRVVEANIFYGGHGTDNVINLSRTATWIVKMNPDVASLIEVLGGSNDPALLLSLLQQQTGITWYSYYVPKYSGCPEGVMVLSKWPITSSSQYFMSYQMPVAQVTLNVNGKSVNLFSTHFQWPKTSSAQRQVEATELIAFANKFAEPRIITGDFNAQDGTPEMNTIEQSYTDAWVTAVNANAAVAYADEPANLGPRTRRSRIDHTLYSKNATTVFRSRAGRCLTHEI